MTDAPGLEFFKCERLNATLSTAGCARQWRKANQDPDHRVQTHESLWHCRACSTGAANAGEKGVIAGFSELIEDVKRICPRCRRLSPRLINGLHCISCYNRSREARIGKNAKGHPPALMKLLHAERLVVVEDGNERVVELRCVRDLEEALIRVARKASGPITIGRPRRDPLAMAVGEVPAAAVFDDEAKPPPKLPPPPPPEPGPTYISSKEAAELAGVPIETLYWRMKQPGAPAWQKFGNRIFVQRDAFLAWEGARRGAVQGEARAG